MKPHIKTRSWRRVVLPISLVANIFFIAMIGGYWFKIEMRQPVPPESITKALAQGEAVLSRSDAKKFAAVMDRDAPLYMPAAQQLDAARTQLIRQLTAPSFNEAAARQALVTWQASWNRFINGVSGPFIDALAQISPQDRIKLIDLRRMHGGTAGNP